MVQIKLFIAFILVAAVAPAIALPVPVKANTESDRTPLIPKGQNNQAPIKKGTFDRVKKWVYI